MERALAAKIVRDQWGIWARVVAVAETLPAGAPALFYVIEYKDQKGRRGHMTVGSTLDSREEQNLRDIAADIHKRTGVIARSYVVVELQSVLADVRRNAKNAGYDWSDPFLPLYGDPRLEEILKPYDDSAPDRAIVIGNPKAVTREAERARRAGILARANVEANLPPAKRP